VDGAPRRRIEWHGRLARVPNARITAQPEHMGESPMPPNPQTHGLAARATANQLFFGLKVREPLALFAAARRHAWAGA